MFYSFLLFSNFWLKFSFSFINVFNLLYIVVCKHRELLHLLTVTFLISLNKARDASFCLRYFLVSPTQRIKGNLHFEMTNEISRLTEYIFSCLFDIDCISEWCCFPDNSRRRFRTQTSYSLSLLADSPVFTRLSWLSWWDKVSLLQGWPRCDRCQTLRETSGCRWVKCYIRCILLSLVASAALSWLNFSFLGFLAC